MPFFPISLFLHTLKYNKLHLFLVFILLVSALFPDFCLDLGLSKNGEYTSQEAGRTIAT